MNRKIRCITQGGLAAKSLNEALDMTVIYKVRPEFGFGGWFAVATSSSTVEEFDTELEARMVNA
jgi:hypothetical protein